MDRGRLSGRPRSTSGERTAVFPTRVHLAWTASVDNRTQVSYTVFVDGHVFKVVARDYFDPPSQILYQVFVNGALARTAIGYTDDIVYCQVSGANTIAVRAMDTSGNVSPFSNEIVFDC